MYNYLSETGNWTLLWPSLLINYLGWLNKHIRTQQKNWCTLSLSLSCGQSKENWTTTRKLFSLIRKDLRMVSGLSRSFAKQTLIPNRHNGQRLMHCLHRPDDIAHVLFECIGVTQNKPETLGIPRFYIDLHKSGDLVRKRSEGRWAD